MRIWREFTFESAHSLPEWPEIHGHSYVVRISFAGEAGADYAAVMAEIDRACNPVIAMLDHKMLNTLMPVPTMENIARFIWQKLHGISRLLCCIEVFRPTCRMGVIYEGEHSDVLEHKLARAQQELKFMRDALEHAYKMANQRGLA